MVASSLFPPTFTVDPWSRSVTKLPAFGFLPLASVAMVGSDGGPPLSSSGRGRVSRPGPSGPGVGGGPARRSTDEAADPDDLKGLVQDHGEAVYRLALSVVRDASLAEDVAQDTLLKAWLALPSFRGDASLRSWVMRIAHNTAISTLRTRRALVMDPQDLPERSTIPERSVERRVESSVVLEEFVRALDGLDELSRSIVVLRELESMSYDEIAEVLSVPLPTVKTRLLRARRRLGTVLKEWA